jgi:hypothetical protein
MAQRSRKKAKRRHPLVKIVNGWQKPLRRGDRVTLIRRGHRTELVVSRVLAGAP